MAARPRLQRNPVLMPERARLVRVDCQCDFSGFLAMRGMWQSSWPMTAAARAATTRHALDCMSRVDPCDQTFMPLIASEPLRDPFRRRSIAAQCVAIGSRPLAALIGARGPVVATTRSPTNAQPWGSCRRAPSPFRGGARTSECRPLMAFNASCPPMLGNHFDRWTHTSVSRRLPSRVCSVSLHRLPA